MSSPTKKELSPPNSIDSANDIHETIAHPEQPKTNQLQPSTHIATIDQKQLPYDSYPPTSKSETYPIDISLMLTKDLFQALASNTPLQHLRKNMTNTKNNRRKFTSAGQNGTLLILSLFRHY
ncbi:hypothetical protein Salat_2511400 [Sesamum alatum]|uniref:Uncharacterized protein n=1 Tax=Sesamum alatum TaxID=300844 RepID=A0AAE1XRT9_9LAMI|nr:hypothetical protein Salat_2511400 [Sesamum alatum]